MTEEQKNGIIEEYNYTRRERWMAKILKDEERGTYLFGVKIGLQKAMRILGYRLNVDGTLEELNDDNRA